MVEMLGKAVRRSRATGLCQNLEAKSVKMGKSAIFRRPDEF